MMAKRGRGGVGWLAVCWAEAPCHEEIEIYNTQVSRVFGVWGLVGPKPPDLKRSRSTTLKVVSYASGCEARGIYDRRWLPNKYE